MYPRHEINLDATEYHQRPEISNSMLKWIAKSPAHFHHHLGAHVAPTKAMEIGTVYHTLLLEPQLIDSMVVVNDDSRNSTKFKEFKAANTDKVILKEVEYTQLRDMAKSLLRTDWGKTLFTGEAKRELSLFWQDEDTGTACRCRIDLIKMGNKPVLVDLKTTCDASEEGFWKSIRNYDYHVQAAFYFDAYKAVFGVEPHSFVFAMTEKTAPYVTAFYIVGNPIIEAGRAIYKKRLGIVKQCHESGVWQGYADTPTEPTPPQYITYFLEEQTL